MMMKILSSIKEFYLKICTDHNAQTMPGCLSNLLTAVAPCLAATFLEGCTGVCS